MKSDSELINRIRNEFSKRYGDNGDAVITRSPGRINLIGEHTDYNNGFVLPSAIDRAIYLEVAPGIDHRARVRSLDLDQTVEFDVGRPERSELGWANYLIGVVEQLNRGGHKIGGFDCVFAGDIPIGAGMSSSAAIEAGLGFTLDRIFDLGIERVEMAKIAQRAENEFVGVRCGIMDQIANLLSRGGSALRLDCRSLQYEYVPFTGNDLKFVLCDTGVKHDLALSEYNARRAQCETGVEIIRRRFPEIRSLRDVDIRRLDDVRSDLGQTVYNRCRFVIEENSRVVNACESLGSGDFVSFGEALYKSHEGLRDMYEVTCKELDVLVDTAAEIGGVLGARMMGGGFGGCTLNLVRNSAVDDFKNEIRESYNRATGLSAKIYECKLTPGTEVVHD